MAIQRLETEQGQPRGDSREGQPVELVTFEITAGRDARVMYLQDVKSEIDRLGLPSPLKERVLSSIKRASVKLDRGEVSNSTKEVSGTDAEEPAKEIPIDGFLDRVFRTIGGFALHELSPSEQRDLATLIQDFEKELEGGNVIFSSEIVNPHHNRVEYRAPRDV